MPLRMLRLREVMIRTGLSRSTIYDYIRRGTFPKQVVLGAQSVGWIEAEIHGWIAARVNESRIPIISR